MLSAKITMFNRFMFTWGSLTLSRHTEDRRSVCYTLSMQHDTWLEYPDVRVAKVPGLSPLSFSLNMQHDSEGNFCDDKTNIMSTGGGGGTTAFKWSSCSKDALYNFL